MADKFPLEALMAFLSKFVEKMANLYNEIVYFIDPSTRPQNS